MTTIYESTVEAAALEWLSGLGWQVAHGPDIAPDAPNAERASYDEVVLERRLRDALAKLNPDLPIPALDDALRKLTHPEGPTLEARNHAFHRMLVDGVTVEYRTADGDIRGAQARAVDFDDPSNNDWLAVNQFTVTENKYNRRPDVALFVNGLPLCIIELKNPADEDATIWTAWQQLQTYKAELSNLFSMNEMLMVSDGTQSRIGALTTGTEWFKPWRTITGGDPGRPQHDRASGDAGGRLRNLTFPPDDPRLHRVRGRRQRRAHQEDGGLSPVSRRASSRRRDAKGRRAAASCPAGCR